MEPPLVAADSFNQANTWLFSLQTLEGMTQTLQEVFDLRANVRLQLQTEFGRIAALPGALRFGDAKDFYLPYSRTIVRTSIIRDGKSKTVLVNADAITDGKQQDIPLQAGDTIKVDAKVF